MVAIGIGTSFGSLQNIFCNTPDGPAVVVCCKGRHALDEDFNSIRLFSVDSCVPLASTLPIFEYNGLPFLGSDSTAYLPRTAIQSVSAFAANYDSRTISSVAENVLKRAKQCSDVNGDHFQRLFK